MQSVAGKKVLITGAAMGMGRIYADMAVREGAAAVVLWDINQAALEQAAAELRAAGGKVHAQVVDVAQLPKNGRVVFGTTVQLADTDSGDELNYQIVGEDEADIKKGLISVNSPIARALIGKNQGDVVQVKTPGGNRELEIVKVQYL